MTWEWDWDRKGVYHGHYFQNGYEEAKHDFVRRGGLLPKEALFEPEQLDEIASDERVTFAVELCEQ